MNPADLRLDTIQGLDSTPPLSARTLPGSAIAGKNGKIPANVPRVDTEPIYTALKVAIGEGWTTYKEALSGFLLGKLNQSELTFILTPLFAAHLSGNNASTSPLSTSHLHNQLLTALYSNALYRDAPPETVAPYVLATDLSTTTSTTKTSTGASDAIDDRNKREVMALSARDRRRIKSVREPTPAQVAAQPRTASTSALAQAQSYRAALDALPSSALYPGLGTTTSGSSTSAAALGNKTNVDLEIRRRFAVPLGAETHEFPTRENISARIEPICYEEGLNGTGTTSTATLAELVETAMEVYVKELVGAWAESVDGQRAGLVQTRRYKRRLRREERAEDAGDVARDALGRLPVEVEADEKRRGLSRGDLRLAYRLDGPGWAREPFLRQGLKEDVDDDEDGDGDVPMDDGGREVQQVLTNGHAPRKEMNGVKTVNGTAMDLDDDDDGDWGWTGGGRAERLQLMDVLEGALVAS